MSDIPLTTHQAKALAGLADRYPGEMLMLQPPIVGAIAVYVGGETHVIDKDGSA